MLSKQAKSSYNFAAGVKTQWPIFIYNRCLLPYIPKIKFPKKLLWLDTDTIISKDLSDLFKIDISNYEWAGRKDINKISRFRPPMWITDKKFCNSCPIQNGVMLLNTEKCNIIFKKVIETYWKKDVGSGGSDMILFNLFSTKIYELDEKFNAYKYHPDNYIHHACGTRVCNGWIFGRMFLDHIHKKYTDGFFPLKNIFSKTLRVKPSEDLFYKIYPQYKKYLNIYNELND
jgi:lipopolysaccharide biosynthesis glycosyltransferase